MRQFIAIFLLLIQVFVSAAEMEPATTLNIPMRDGLFLPADVYLPHPDARHLPCILLRLPAGRKAKPWVDYSALSQLGYAVVIQDARNALDPEGKTFPFLSDGWWKNQDGYDTVQWLSTNEYTNGSIGTVGFSAAGITQVLLAPTAPAALKCQYIGTAPGSLYHHAIYPGGQILKNQVEAWLGMYARDQGVLNQVCGLPFYREFWEYLNAIPVANQVTVPAIHYGGWYDTFLQGTIDNFVARQNEGAEGARGKQKLIIGPWTHYFPASTKLGDFEVPSNGLMPPFDMSPQRWFAYYLKGEKNGADEIPPVSYYVMGPFDGTASSGNVWKSSPVWPVPCKETLFYLTHTHQLISSIPEQTGILSYLYDPQAPVPTQGGCNLFLEAGPKDQSSLEQRGDVLIFTSDLLSEDVEVTGRVKAHVFFASDQKDTDVVVRLTDVYPDGRSVLIVDGIHRTGMCNCEKDEAFNPKEPQAVDVDLWSTSAVFAKGHRIRVTLTSSNYPKYEKNMNVGVVGANSGSFEIAHNSFYVGGEHASYIVLPIIP